MLSTNGMWRNKKGEGSRYVQSFKKNSIMFFALVDRKPIFDFCLRIHQYFCLLEIKIKHKYKCIWLKKQIHLNEWMGLMYPSYFRFYPFYRKFNWFKQARMKRWQIVYICYQWKFGWTSASHGLPGENSASLWTQLQVCPSYPILPIRVGQRHTQNERIIFWWGLIYNLNYPY